MSVEVASSLKRAEGEAAHSPWFASFCTAYLAKAKSQDRSRLLQTNCDYLILHEPPHKTRSMELPWNLRKEKDELEQQITAIDAMLAAIEDTKGETK